MKPNSFAILLAFLCLLPAPLLAQSASTPIFQLLSTNNAASTNWMALLLFPNATNGTRKINLSNLLEVLKGFPNWPIPSGAGEANQATNGTTNAINFGIFAQKTGLRFDFYTIEQGSNIVLFQSSTSIVINATGGGGGGNATNAQPPSAVLTNLSATGVAAGATNASAYIASSAGRGSNIVVTNLITQGRTYESNSITIPTGAGTLTNMNPLYNDGALTVNNVLTSGAAVITGSLAVQGAGSTYAQDLSVAGVFTTTTDSHLANPTYVAIIPNVALKTTGVSTLGPSTTTGDELDFVHGLNTNIMILFGRKVENLNGNATNLTIWTALHFMGLTPNRAAYIDASTNLQSVVGFTGSEFVRGDGSLGIPSGTGEINYNGDAGLTNATHISWINAKQGVTNFLKTVLAGYGLVVTNENGTNLSFAVLPIWQLGSQILTNLTGTGALTNLVVAEADGSPSVNGVNKIVVSNGSLTDNGAGQVTISTGGSGGGGGGGPFNISQFSASSTQTNIIDGPAITNILARTALLSQGVISNQTMNLGVPASIGHLNGTNQFYTLNLTTNVLVVLTNLKSDVGYELTVLNTNASTLTWSNVPSDAWMFGAPSAPYSNGWSRFLFRIDSATTRTQAWDINFERNLASAGGITLHSNATTITISNAVWVGGYRTIYIDAAACVSNQTQNGTFSGATFQTQEYSAPTNRMIDQYVFADAITNAIQFKVAFPDEWDLGTVKVKFFWSSTNAIANQTNVWAIQGQAISQGDPLDGDWGNEQIVRDKVTGANNLQLSPATPALTIGGTPALGDLCWFRVKRLGNHTDDAMTGGQSRLLSIRIQYHENNSEPAPW